MNKPGTRTGEIIEFGPHKFRIQSSCFGMFIDGESIEQWNEKNIKALDSKEIDDLKYPIEKHYAPEYEFRHVGLVSDTRHTGWGVATFSIKFKVVRVKDVVVK